MRASLLRLATAAKPHALAKEAIHAKSPYGPASQVKGSVIFELACATVMGFAFAGAWKSYHWRERKKITDFYATYDPVTYEKK